MKKDRFAFEAERNNTNNAPFLCNAKTFFLQKYNYEIRREDFTHFAYWYLCKSKE
jgi:hypothetical protein